MNKEHQNTNKSGKININKSLNIHKINVMQLKKSKSSINFQWEQ